MRIFAAFVLILSLGGCAGYQTTDLTPEQRTRLAIAVLSRPQPQPYMLPMPAPPAAPRNCISTVSGQTIYTNCN